MKRERAELVEKDHPKLSMRTQCKLLVVTRSSLDYQPVVEDPEDLRIIRLMDAALCLGALADAVAGSGGRLPDIFNTDQGSQFTCGEWTGALTELNIAISMDGKGRWMDNVFIERLWRSVKHEEIYLREYGALPELEAGLQAWFERYNTWRPHQALDNRTPSQAHAEGLAVHAAATANPRPQEAPQAA